MILLSSLDRRTATSEGSILELTSFETEDWRFARLTGYNILPWNYSAYSLWFPGVGFAMAANPILGCGEEDKQLHRLAQSKISLSLGRNICCFQWREIDNCLLFMDVIFIFPSINLPTFIRRSRGSTRWRATCACLESGCSDLGLTSDIF